MWVRQIEGNIPFLGGRFRKAAQRCFGMSFQSPIGYSCSEACNLQQIAIKTLLLFPSFHFEEIVAEYHLTPKGSAYPCVEQMHAATQTVTGFPPGSLTDFRVCCKTPQLCPEEQGRGGTLCPATPCGRSAEATERPSSNTTGSGCHRAPRRVRSSSPISESQPC